MTLLAICLETLAACSSIQYDAIKTKEHRKMSVHAAKATFRRLYSSSEKSHDASWTTKEIKFANHEISYDLTPPEDGSGTPLRCQIRLDSDDTFQLKSMFGQYYIDAATFAVCHFGFRSREDGLLLVDTLWTLRNRDRLVEDDQREFLKNVSGYQKMNATGNFPEDARRYKVQAETALKEKRFGDAIVAYTQTLEKAPWWAAGYFNQALLLGEQEEYADAISTMKKYLAIFPDAPDARKAQDKIYAWEGKMK